MINFILDSKSFSIKEEVESIYLFGSTARGDADSYSDLDILIIIDDCDDTTFFQIKKSIEEQLKLPPHWISLYRLSSIYNMCSYGSYFLWHVKNEGIALYSRSGIFEQILASISEYTRTKTDLDGYLIVCKDIENTILKDDSTIAYELSVLASIARNTCIALAYINNIKTFGRISSVQACIKLLGSDFPFSIEEYSDLYKFRIAYKRGFNDLIPFPPTAEYVVCWIKKVIWLIEYAINLT